MSTQPTKKLYRSRDNRMISGVAGGLAEYLNMDVTLVRVAIVILTIITGFPLLIYIAMIFIVPEEPIAGAGTEF